MRVAATAAGTAVSGKSQVFRPRWLRVQGSRILSRISRDFLGFLTAGGIAILPLAHTRRKRSFCFRRRQSEEPDAMLSGLSPAQLLPRRSHNAAIEGTMPSALGSAGSLSSISGRTERSSTEVRSKRWEAIYPSTKHSFSLNSRRRVHICGAAISKPSPAIPAIASRHRTSDRAVAAAVAAAPSTLVLPSRVPCRSDKR